ncbi:MAG TPA: SRPBCC domain-containing protein [Caulobacter sp.]|nr:SRPBCC domain-containing protein [Caulobacter sp.]
MKSAIAALAGAAQMLVAGAASAEVKSTWEAGLRTENRVVVAAPPEKVYLALGEIGRWWNGEHSYSGDSRNMTIELKPGGCFCEALPGGGVMHGEVILAWPGTTLRIRGGFGPLQDEGASGALTFNLKKVEGGTEVVQTYAIGGLRPEMVKAAPLFDSVFGEQLTRFKSYVETGQPTK